MSSGFATVHCQCKSCGYQFQRALRQMARPCPGCHQRSVEILPGADRTGARVLAAVMALLMALSALVIWSLSR